MAGNIEQQARFIELRGKGMSFQKIAEEMGVSKPTLIKLFKELAEKNILVKVQHKTYRFNEKTLENL